ncbi:MAG: DUF1127 domain-containing protein [Pseudolabrys sp.]
MSCGSSTCKSSIFIVATSRPSALAWSIPNPFELAGRMQERWRQRQQLLELDDHQLLDIGISRRQANDEARKPFWK